MELLKCLSLWVFGEEKFPDRECFCSSINDRTTGNNGEKLKAHLNDEDYLTCNNILNEFKMKYMGDYHDHYLKKRCFAISWRFWKVYWHMLKILQTRSSSLF